MIAAVPDLCIGRIDAVPAAGYCKIAPNKVNTISGRIVFELDIRSMVEGKAKFVPFGGIPGMEVLNIPGFDVDFKNWTFRQQFINRMNDRLKFVKSRQTEKGGMDALPPDALNAIQSVIDYLNK